MSAAAATKKIWAESTPIVGTLGETYLQSRGVSLPSPAPQCLRFAPKLQHPNQQYFPALLVRATEPQTGAPTDGVQRVFLAWSGKGKAQVERKEQKMSLGPMRGGVARLAEPVDGKPLLLGEGVETVLTAMEATGLPGWATFGTSGIKNLALPDTVKRVILLAENDSGPNDRAFAILIPALAKCGTKVNVAKPPVGLKDFNDLVNGTSGHTPHAGLAVVKAAIEGAMAGDVAGKSAGAAGEPDDDADGKFSLTKTGLYRRKNKKWEWIAQAFEVLSLARDAAADGAAAAGWGKLLRFRNPDGATCEVVVSAASLHGDAGQLIGSLADQGMNIKCTMTARRQFVEYLASVEVSERATIAHCTGWIEIGEKRAFALPGEIISAGLRESVILAKGMSGPYGRRGTLEDWKNSVGTLATGHRLLRFSIATAFAGTLLGLGGFESGVFHLHGRSSEGKTTCLRCGASVWGSGADGGYVRTWRATANGLEANLAGACDTLLPLDEVGQAEGKEIGQALYMATSGIGKARMRRDASLKPSHKWRVLMLSSGELPIETKLNEGMRRGRAHAGHLVRAIDIVAKRALGAFDLPDIEFDPKAFADELKRVASTHYGAAGPEFVRHLIERQVTGEDVRRRVVAFAKDALEGIRDYHGQAARTAERFGLVAAAGELAIEFGIVPWVKGKPTEDAKELFAAWLEERGGAMPYETRQIVAQVRHFIEAHGDSRFDDITTPDPDRKPVVNRAGWRAGKDENRRWYVLPEVWRRDICTGLNPTEAARVLAGLGALEKGSDGRPTQSLRLPDMKTQRLYVMTPAIFEGWGKEA